MVRAILEKGVIRPLESLPEHWSEGRELVVDEAVDTPSQHDLDTWFRDVDALAEDIPPEDFERLDQALADADQEAKAQVRRQMNLP